ncbi:MAG: type II toxin-antitoxin system HicB family antitoxin [Bacteroidales bacterium]|nr:type II toxin-antitoxin system HicB family antitoxin [Bacteroidales bacterium]
MKYTIRIKKNRDGWLSGQCEQLPEAVTQGKDMADLMDNMKDAIELVLECKKAEFDRLNKEKNIIRKRLTMSYEKNPVAKILKRKRLRTV